MAIISCVKCGKEAEGLTDPPAGGTLGERIMKNTCAHCWQEWENQKTLVINHYGLVLADPDDRKKLIAYMKEFLNLEPA